MQETLDLVSKAWETIVGYSSSLVPAWSLLAVIGVIVLFNGTHSLVKRWKHRRKKHARTYMPQVLEGYVIALNHLHGLGVISMVDKLTELRRLKSCGFNTNIFMGGVIDPAKIHAHLTTVKHDLKKGRARKETPVVRKGKVLSFS